MDAMMACLTDGIVISGDILYISLAIPNNPPENECAIRAVGDQGSWLGFTRVGKLGWIDALSTFLGVPVTPMSAHGFEEWAWGQPTRMWGEDYMVQIGPNDPTLAPGRYDWIWTAKWYPLCATRYCR